MDKKTFKKYLLLGSIFYFLSTSLIFAECDTISNQTKSTHKKQTAKLDGTVNVLDYGAKGNGTTDDTNAIQKALNAASKKGGKVMLPPDKYLVKGSLNIPNGVTLQGVSEAANSAFNDNPLLGSVIFATGGRDNESAPALFEMNSSTAVRGLTVFYPEQNPEDIRPYPWTFHIKGRYSIIENITLINSYNGIKAGPEPNECHTISKVFGCVLRRGIYIDNTTDIGRIENVQFNPNWWSTKQVNGDGSVVEYMKHNCEGFIFGRTDWEYVTNTFIFGTTIGYKFIKTQNGSANGQFSGIGSDCSTQACVLVEDIQPMGLLITNGEFVAMQGENPISIVIKDTCTGSVRFQNCSFWGPSKQILLSNSKNFVSISNCYLAGGENNRGKPIIEADSGKLQVTDCSFASGERSVLLKKGLAHAIITGNNGARGVEIINEIGDKAVISNNEPFKQ